jgi:multicomponent Na+:H+ antiporter subunit D
MKVQKYAFFGKLNEKYKEIKEVPIYMKIAMIALAVICLIGGLVLLPQLSKYLLSPAVDVLANGIRYKDIVMGALK